MAAWQFRCVCCGELREAPMTRPEGTVYLRCIVSRQWAWYDPSAFVAAAATVSALRLGNGGNGTRAPRAGAGRRTRGTARTARGATRTTRGTARTARGTARTARGTARTARGVTRATRGAAGRKAGRRARKRR